MLQILDPPRFVNFLRRPLGDFYYCLRLTPCFTQNASEALWDLPED